MELSRSVLSLLLLFCVDVVYSQCDNYSKHPPSRLIPAIGSTLTVECVATESRLFAWLKGSSALDGFNGVIANGGCDCEFNNTALTFRSFRPEDAGNFTCSINNGGGVFFQCPFEVIVPENPTVTLPLGSYDLDVAAMLDVSPTINFGRPQGTIEWLFEDAPLQAASGVTIDVSTGSLMISSIQGSHRGRYTIRVMNEHSNASASFNLTVYFLQQPTVMLLSGADQLGCTVVGQWRQTPTITWIPTPPVTTPTTDTLINAATRKASQIATVDLCVSYMCRVGDSQTGQAVSEPIRLCSGPSVTLINNTAVMVTWDDMIGVTSYRIRYGLAGQTSGRLVTGAVQGQSIQIGGLMAGIQYEFELGTVDSSSPTLTYSSPSQLTLAGCPSSVGTPSNKVVNVRAMLYSSDGRKTVRLTWDASPDPVVRGYRVSVNSDPPQSFVVTDTSFLLDPSYCDGQTYMYSVEAVNECNLGMHPETVMFKCATQIQFSVVGSSDSTFTFRVDANSSRIKPNTPVKILIITILPKDNVRVSSTYVMQTYVQTLCVKDLMKATYYNICLCTDFIEGLQDSNEKICIQRQTTDGSDSSNSQSCLSATSTSTEKVESASSAVAFPDWAIAVIVIGVLAMVALIFCFIGVYYACNSNKSKDYIYGSTPSLQASSVNMPHTMHNVHRSVSPPHSCLSYAKGHSTNWNEHRDTLRQMETTKGTHV